MRSQLTVYLLLFLILPTCTPDSNDKIRSAKNTSTSKLLTTDGAWCWFSDPRAIYHRGEREQVYFGYINSQGDVCIGSQDLHSEEIRSFVLHDTLEIDDHNVPSILVLPGGKLLAFYNEHNGNV